MKDSCKNLHTTWHLGLEKNMNTRSANDFVEIWNKFRRWNLDPSKGGLMPGYDYGNGPDHLKDLCKVHLLTEIPDYVVDGLLGPNSWAFYRVLVIRADKK